MANNGIPYLTGQILLPVALSGSEVRQMYRDLNLWYAAHSLLPLSVRVLSGAQVYPTQTGQYLVVYATPKDPEKVFKVADRKELRRLKLQNILKS